MKLLRLAVDVGGTFTDVACIDVETLELHVAKVLNDPSAPGRAIGEGVAHVLANFARGAEDVDVIVHGTTLVSNALLERKGARTGLLTTAGFRDILETRTEKRYDLYDFNAELPDPLVPRSRRLGVPERIDSDGAVVIPLEADGACSAIQRLIADGVESIAICFLHSYRNPSHEQEVARLVDSMAPQIPVSLSSEVAPQIREYPRVSTTVANAYVRTIVQRHVEATRTLLKGLGYNRGFYMMVSGAVIDSETAMRSPIRLVDSGAAAGAVAAASYGAAAGRSNIVSFEMGGTSAKFCVIEGGRPSITNAYEVARVNQSRPGSGMAIALPATDVAEIGSGGGSIAWADQMGLLRVGPRSAGSWPGPACYGRGGEDPTVTDANLVLGYISPSYFLGGEMVLSADLAARALDRLGEQLGMTGVEAAWGVHQVVTENMLASGRQHITDRGYDPRRFSLMAFGGAGPAHAVRFAKELGCSEVVIPQGAGVTSAVGMLSAPFGFDFVQTYVTLLSDIDLAAINRMLTGMERQGRQMLSAAGIPDAAITFTRTCEMRYVGQTHEIAVALPGGELNSGSLDAIRAAYAAEYERLFLHPNLPYQLECTNWRVFAAGPQSSVVPRWPKQTASGAPLKGRRPAYSPLSGRFEDWPVYDRYGLAPGDEVAGPAIIEERETTVILPEQTRAVVDAALSLVVSS